MIRHTLPHIQWAGFLAVTSAMGLLMTLSRCEQNPIIPDLPGSQWIFESDSVDSMVDTVLVRTPSDSASHTLYAGWTDEQTPREAGILIKFASVDTSRLPDLQAATLFLFRRSFADEPPELGANFDLYVIDEPDTAWAESYTGLTLHDFPNLTFHADSSMVVGTVTVLVDGATSDSVLEHLAFPVNTDTLRQWALGHASNNGFLIRQENQGTLVGFYSGENIDLSPYLALTIADTTSTGEDTTRTLYRRPTADLSIYPWPNPNFDSTDSDSLLHLDHSSGVRSHIDFSDSLDLDLTSIIASARLTMHVKADESQIIADQVDIQVRRRVLPLSKGDSTAVLIDKLTYSKESDNLVLKLGNFLTVLATDTTLKNYGLDLVVIPNNHDFDHLVFWGASAPDSLKKPRLEIIYSRPYEEVPQ